MPGTENHVVMGIKGKQEGVIITEYSFYVHMNAAVISWL